MTDVLQVATVEVVVTPEGGIELLEVGVQGPPGVGPKGDKGDPGITVSPTPPLNPQINDLWLQIPGP